MSVQYARDQPKGFTNRIERVAIVGAGGRVGKPITLALLKTGQHVLTALTRQSSSSSPTHLPPGIHHVKPISYSDPSTLVSALQNQQVLIISLAVPALMSSSPSTPSPLETLIRAAAQAGVKYILPNWYGQDPLDEEFIRDVRFASLRDEPTRLIKELGVSSYIQLACGFWYEFSLAGGLDRFGFDLVGQKVRLLDDDHDGAEYKRRKMPVSTWEQCGRAVAGLLSLKELSEDEEEGGKGSTTTLASFRDKAVYVTSFMVTQREMWESVKRVTGTRDEEWEFEDGKGAKELYREAKEGMEKGDVAGNFAKLLYSRAWFPPSDKDGEERKSLYGRDNEVLGLPVEDLDKATAEAVRIAAAGEGAGSH